MKKIFLAAVVAVLFSHQAMAEISVYLGARQGKPDANGLYSQTGYEFGAVGANGYEGGLLYDHNFSNVLGIRTGVGYAQIPYSQSYNIPSITQSGYLNYNFNVIQIPLYMMIHMGPMFNLQLGLQAWNLSSASCAFTDYLATVGSVCTAPTSGGTVMANHAGVGINFGHIEMDFFYEPSVKISDDGAGTTFILTSMGVDFLYKFH